MHLVLGGDLVDAVDALESLDSDLEFELGGQSPPLARFWHISGQVRVNFTTCQESFITLSRWLRFGRPPQILASMAYKILLLLSASTSGKFSSREILLLRRYVDRSLRSELAVFAPKVRRLSASARVLRTSWSMALAGFASGPTSVFADKILPVPSRSSSP
jgi:hypothetical protein